MSKYRIEDTLDQSQRLIQESKGLISKYRHSLEDSMGSLTHYELKISELKEQIHNEQYMKNSYEEALHGLKERLSRLEEQDNLNTLSQEKKLQEHQESLKRQEEDLIYRLKELGDHNRELERYVTNSGLNQDFNKVLKEKRDIEVKYNELFSTHCKGGEMCEKMESELNFFKAQASKVQTLEEEIQVLKDRLNAQRKDNRDLEDALKDPKIAWLSQNTAKIRELEDKVRACDKSYRRLTPKKAAPLRRRRLSTIGNIYSHSSCKTKHS